VIDRDALVFAASIVLCHTSAYILFNSIYHAVSTLPQFDKYRLRPASQHPPQALIQACLQHAVMQHFLVIPLVSYFVLYPLLVSTGIDVYERTPDIWTMLKNLTVCIVVEDALFYWSHRLLHHPLLYKHIHKVC
jgi:sterol desaturase/sphingolipid hydroxylase (fatty acid hydroxylase superfamily)